MKQNIGVFCGGGRVADCYVRARTGTCAKSRGHPQNVLTRQLGEHVDPRRSDVRRRGPMMGVFNNLVMFDQHVKQNSLASIVPDLATAWSWNDDQKREVPRPELAVGAHMKQ